MAEHLRHLDHLLVIEHATSRDFHRPGGGDKHVRPVERRAHGKRLTSELDHAFAEIAAGRGASDEIIEELRALGSIIVLEGAEATYRLELDRLQKYSRHTKKPKQPYWLLLSVHPAEDDTPEQATVWVSDEYRRYFLKLFEDYLDSTTAEGNPKNQNLVANIARIRQAVLTDLWTSDGDPVTTGVRWWELWLDATSGHVEALADFARENQLRTMERSVTIRDRAVMWIEARWEQLQILPFTRVPIAEIRRPEFIDTVEDLTVDEQNEYVADLASRVTPAPDHAPAVSHLDTGVFRQHLLLSDSLAESDHHTIIGLSGNDVHPRGHGTAMAGLALYGDLGPLLVGLDAVRLRHRLESVRMTPRRGERATNPLDFGSATAQAVSTVEITNPRRRAFCLTLSTDPDKAGEPTLWSATTDALAAGTDVVRDGDALRLVSEPDPDAARLILVAAGNVDVSRADYGAVSDTTPVADPAQAWNALTVGAYTDMTDVPTDPQYSGYSALAGAGELSPHSRTSIMFNMRKFPIKPDICMEGGNVITDGDQMFEPNHPLLSLRTTGTANDLALTSANATSAATAQAARLAALAMGRYPEYWPETIRGLLTHAAEWTSFMDAEIRHATSKSGRTTLLRRYGWGVPTVDRVLNSTSQAVTLVSQDQFVPFDGDEYRMRRFRLHELPWPREVLEELGAVDVRLRLTLSYFIEPSASRRGWRSRYAYPSHSLRFDLQGRVETRDEFVKRVNREAQSDEDGSTRASADGDRWLIGPQKRHLGSLHQDEWTGSAAELAGCNSIAVYPVGGWWKNNKRQDRRELPVRYALITSLRTAEEGVDLYTPIANQLRIPVVTPVQVE